MPERKLSTKWRDVIRRMMYATPATADENVRCPDCGSPMHLREGRFGRFYKCWRFECQGTVGARLDGTPRVQKGPPALLRARIQARDAVHLAAVEHDRLVEAGTEFRRARGLDWWNCPHRLAGCKIEFGEIEVVAKLHLVVTHRDRRSFWNRGLFIRRRSIEECERIIEAAAIVRERVKDDFRRLRQNAWDKVVLGEVFDAEPTRQVEDRPLERASVWHV